MSNILCSDGTSVDIYEENWNPNGASSRKLKVISCWLGWKDNGEIFNYMCSKF